MQKLIIMVIEQSRYAAIQQEASAISGVQVNSNSLETGMKMIDLHSNQQSSILTAISEEWQSRSDSNNAYEKSVIELVAKVAANLVATPLFFIQWLPYPFNTESGKETVGELQQLL